MEISGDIAIISLDGSIGAGKSTLLAALSESCPEAEVILEPVGEWLQMKNADGVSLLELFYGDKRRWSYTFQNCALLTRLRAIKEALKTTKKKIIITERSVLTDRYVFAEMLHASGDLDALEWSMYTQWFDCFAQSLPFKGVIYLTTGVDTCAGRIVKRGREGESLIPKEYLAALDAQHVKWVSSTDLAVLQISTEDGKDQAENIATISKFIREKILPGLSKEGGVEATAAATTNSASSPASAAVTPLKASGKHNGAGENVHPETPQKGNPGAPVGNAPPLGSSPISTHE